MAKNTMLKCAQKYEARMRSILTTAKKCYCDGGGELHSPNLEGN